MSKPLDLDAITAYCGAAAPEPWEPCGCGKCCHVWSRPLDCIVAVGITKEDENYTAGDGVSREEGHANAEFFARARTDLPLAVAELREARALLALALDHAYREEHRSVDCYRPAGCICGLTRARVLLEVK